MANDEPIIGQFPNGYKIVKLTKKEHCEAEGDAMGHCVGSYDPEKEDLYSLRDPRGKPHVTIQVKDGRVSQIKGKQNEPPVKKYAMMVIPWVNSILRGPDKLFISPLVNFTYEGFDDYVSSLYDEGLLRKFANNGSNDVKCAVAKNYNTPVDVLRTLSKDGGKYVKWEIAENINTPPDVFRDLIKNIDINATEVTAGWGIASNPSTPPDVLRILSNSKNSAIISKIADNPSTPPDILRALINYDRTYIKQILARNLSTPVDVLRILSRNNDYDVRWYVAYNPNTPIDILKILANDIAPTVKQAAINSINSRQ